MMYDNWIPGLPSDFIEWYSCTCGKFYRRLKSIREHCNAGLFSGNPTSHQPHWVTGTYNPNVAGRYR